MQNMNKFELITIYRQNFEIFRTTRVIYSEKFSMANVRVVSRATLYFFASYDSTNPSHAPPKKRTSRYLFNLYLYLLLPHISFRSLPPAQP